MASQSNGRPTPEQAALLLKNLNRYAVLSALGAETKSPAAIAREIDLPVNLVAYHMGLLAKAGVVELTHTEPRRGSTEHFYRAILQFEEVPTGEVKLIVKKGKEGRQAFYEMPVDIAVRAYPGRRRR